MFAQKRYIVSTVFIIAMFGVATTFQNCSDVHFETTDELLKAGIEGTLRQVSISPKFTEDRPNIDVTTILDDSNSMSFIQDNVKDALSTTTSVLKGFSGTFGLYTTTHEMDKLSRSRDLLNYYKIEDENGNLIPSLSFRASDLTGYKSEFDNMGNPLYSSYEEWTKHLNFSPYKNIAFSRSMTSAQFKQFQDEVSTEIQKVDTSGSPTEIGLCTLLRNLDSYKESSSFHTYIIATNEDDASTPENCLKEESKRWERAQSVQSGGSVSCNESDPNCQFPYTVSYKAPRKFKNQYKRSYVDGQTISYSLKTDSRLKTETRRLSYRTTKRFATHRLKQNKWTIRFKRNVVVGTNDGLPVYQEQTATTPHGGRSTSYGTCSSGTTSYNSCGGMDLTYFNNSIKSTYPDAINGTCEVICQNTTTSEIVDYIDNVDTPTSTTVTYPTTVTSANLAGYTVGCNSYVANKRNYSGLNVPNAAIENCELKHDNLKTVQNDLALNKSLGSCSASAESCSSSQKNSAISSLGWSGVESSLITCENRCSTSSLSGSKNSTSFSARLSGDQLCSGKSAGDSNADVKLSCNTAEMNNALSTIQSSLSSNGVSTTLESSQINCEYTCKHRNSSHLDIGSEVTLDPWENQATQSLNCNEEPFNTVVNPNIFDCRKYFFDGSQPASKTFVSKDPNICGAGHTLASIMAHPDAGAVIDHGSSMPFNNCSRGNGTKSGTDTIKYTWNMTGTTQKSLISEEGIIKTITDKLKEAHGNNFFLAAFINDPSKESTLCKGVNLEDYYGPSNSLEYEGKKFKDLEKALGSKKMKTFPACMPDYKEAMKFVFDLIVTSASRSYKLDLNEEAKEWVYRVKILDKHGLVHSLKEEDFQWDHGLITFSERVNLDNAEMIYIDLVTPYSEI